MSIGTKSRKKDKAAAPALKRRKIARDVIEDMKLMKELEL